MKIIHALWSLETGGTESMLVDIANEQVKEHEVFIVVVNNELSNLVLNRIDPRCKIFCCYRKQGSRSPFPLLKFNFYLWKIHADIIHVHMDNLGYYLWFTHGAKKVRTIHCAFGNGKDYKHYDKLFSISKGVRQYTLTQGFDSIIVYNGIHPGQIMYRKRYTDYKGVLKVVNVGRLQKIKGQQLLIEAAHKLILLGHENFTIDFIGDGDNHKNLEKMIHDYKLEQHIRLLGMKSRNYIYDNLCSYDLYVQPSLSEGFGLTLAEAMVAGVPVVTSNQTGPMEVIGNGKYGISFETNNVSSLTEVLLDVLSKGARLDSDNARNFVLRNFDIKNTAKNYIQEYYRIIQ